MEEAKSAVVEVEATTTTSSSHGLVTIRPAARKAAPRMKVILSRPHTTENVSLGHGLHGSAAENERGRLFASTAEPSRMPPPPVAAMPASNDTSSANTPFALPTGSVFVIRSRASLPAALSPTRALDESKEAVSPPLAGVGGTGVQSPKSFTIRPHSRINRAATPRTDSHRRERSYTAEMEQAASKGPGLSATPGMSATPGAAAAQLSARIQQAALFSLARPATSPETGKDDANADASRTAPHAHKGSLRRPRRALVGMPGALPGQTQTVTLGSSPAVPRGPRGAGGQRGSVLVRADHLAELAQRSQIDAGAESADMSFRHSFLFSGNAAAMKASLRQNRGEDDDSSSSDSDDSDDSDDSAGDDIRSELLSGVGFSTRRESDAPRLHPASQQLIRMDPAEIASDHHALHAHLTEHAPVIVTRDLLVVEHWLTEQAIKFQRKADGESATNADANSNASSGGSSGTGTASSTNPDGSSQFASSMATDTAGDYQSPLDKLGIGRRLLEKAGLPGALTDRVYIGLFTYTVGFYDCVAQLCKHVSQRRRLLARVWRVYLANLESCEAPLYAWVIECVRTENARREDLRRQEHQHRCGVLRTHTKHLRKKVRIMRVNADALHALESAEKTSMRELGTNLREMHHRHELDIERRANAQSAIAEWTINAFETESAVSDVHHSLTALNRARTNLHADIETLRQQLQALVQTVADGEAQLTQLQTNHVDLRDDVARREREVMHADQHLQHLLDNVQAHQALLREQQTRAEELEDIMAAQDAYMKQLAENGLHADLSPLAQESVLRQYQADSSRLRTSRAVAAAAAAARGSRDAPAAVITIPSTPMPLPPAPPADAPVDGFDTVTGEMTPEEMRRRGLHTQVDEMHTLKAESGAKIREFASAHQTLVADIAVERERLAQTEVKTATVRERVTTLANTRDSKRDTLHQAETRLQQLVGPTLSRATAELASLDASLLSQKAELVSRQERLTARRRQMAETVEKLRDLSNLEEACLAQVTQLDAEQHALADRKVTLDVEVGQLTKTHAKKVRHQSLLEAESAPLYVNYTNRIGILKKELELHEHDKRLHQTMMLNELQNKKAKERALREIKEKIEEEKKVHEQTREKVAQTNMQIESDNSTSAAHTLALTDIRSLIDRESMSSSHFVEISSKEVTEVESRIRLAEAHAALEAQHTIDAEAELQAARALNARTAEVHRVRIEEVRASIALQARELDVRREKKAAEKAALSYASEALRKQVAEAEERLRLTLSKNDFLRVQAESVTNDTFQVLMAIKLRSREAANESNIAQKLAETTPRLEEKLSQIESLSRREDSMLETRLRAETTRHTSVKDDLVAAESRLAERLANQETRFVQAATEDEAQLDRDVIANLPDSADGRVLIPTATVLKHALANANARRETRAKEEAEEAARAASAASTAAAIQERERQATARSPAAVARPSSHRSTVAFEDSASEYESESEYEYVNVPAPPAEVLAPVETASYTESLESFDASSSRASQYVLVVSDEEIDLRPGDELIEETLDSESEESLKQGSPRATPRARRFIRRPAPLYIEGAGDDVPGDQPSSRRIKVFRFQPSFFLDQPAVEPAPPPPSTQPVEPPAPVEPHAHAQSSHQKQPHVISKNAPGSLLQGEHPDIVRAVAHPHGSRPGSRHQAKRPSSRASQPSPQVSPTNGTAIEPMIRRIRFSSSSRQATPSNAAVTAAAGDANTATSPAGVDLAAVPLRPYFVVYRPSPAGSPTAAAGAAATTPMRVRKKKKKKARLSHVHAPQLASAPTATSQPSPKATPAALRAQAQAHARVMLGDVTNSTPSPATPRSGSSNKKAPVSAPKPTIEHVDPRHAVRVARYEIRHAEWQRRMEERAARRAVARAAAPDDAPFDNAGLVSETESEPRLSDIDLDEDDAADEYADETTTPTETDEEDRIVEADLPAWKREFSAAETVRLARRMGGGPVADDESDVRSRGLVGFGPSRRDTARREQSVRDMLASAEREARMRKERDARRAEKRAARRAAAAVANGQVEEDDDDDASHDEAPVTEPKSTAQWDAAWAKHEARLAALNNEAIDADAPDEEDDEAMQAHEPDDSHPVLDDTGAPVVSARARFESAATRRASKRALRQAARADRTRFLRQEMQQLSYSDEEDAEAALASHLSDADRLLPSKGSRLTRPPRRPRARSGSVSEVVMLPTPTTTRRTPMTHRRSTSLSTPAASSSSATRSPSGTDRDEFAHLPRDAPSSASSAASLFRPSRLSGGAVSVSSAHVSPRATLASSEDAQRRRRSGAAGVASPDKRASLKAPGMPPTHSGPGPAQRLSPSASSHGQASPTSDSSRATGSATRAAGSNTVRRTRTPRQTGIAAIAPTPHVLPPRPTLVTDPTIARIDISAWSDIAVTPTNQGAQNAPVADDRSTVGSSALPSKRGSLVASSRSLRAAPRADLPPTFQAPVTARSVLAGPRAAAAAAAAAAAIRTESQVRDRAPRGRGAAAPFISRLERAAARLAASTASGLATRRKTRTTNARVEAYAATLTGVSASARVSSEATKGAAPPPPAVQSIADAMSAAVSQPQSPALAPMSLATPRSPSHSPSHSPPRPSGRRAFATTAPLPPSAAPTLHLPTSAASSPSMQPAMTRTLSLSSEYDSSPQLVARRVGPPPPPAAFQPTGPSALIMFDAPFFARAHAAAIGDAVRDAARSRPVAPHSRLAGAPHPPSTAPSGSRSRTRSRSQSRSQSRKRFETLDEAEGARTWFTEGPSPSYSNSNSPTRATAGRAGEPIEAWVPTARTLDEVPTPVEEEKHSSVDSAATIATLGSVPPLSRVGSGVVVGPRSVPFRVASHESGGAAAGQATDVFRPTTAPEAVLRRAASLTARGAEAGAASKRASLHASGAMTGRPVTSWRTLRPVPWPAEHDTADQHADLTRSASSRPRTSSNSAALSQTARSPSLPVATRVPDFIKRTMHARAAEQR